jgi:hypothetical protein
LNPKKLPEGKAVVDHFYIVQDTNRKVDEARKIEQDVRKVENMAQDFFNRKREPQ